MSCHQIENQRDGRQYGGPLRNEVHRPPRLIINSLRHHEETDIPSYDQQSIERTEERLYLPVAEDEDGIRTKSGRRQQDGKQRPHIKVPMSQRIGEPQVIHPRHIQSGRIVGTYLRTKANDGQYNRHRQKNGLFTLPHSPLIF